MSMHDWDDDEGPYVVIERSEPGVGSFVMGLAIGAGIALLFAPRTGEETRRDLQRRARRVGDQAQDFVSEVSESVTERVQQARVSWRPHRFGSTGCGDQAAPGYERS